MSEKLYTVSLKGQKPSDPWTVVNADGPDELGQALQNLSDALLQKIADTNSLFAAACNAANGGVTTPTPAQAAPQQQAQPQQSAWGQQQAAPQQQRQQQGGRPPAVQHPEGKQCDLCGNVLELKTTQNGKKKWQCSEWRWNGGNPNGHGMEWANNR